MQPTANTPDPDALVSKMVAAAESLANARAVADPDAEQQAAIELGQSIVTALEQDDPHLLDLVVHEVGLLSAEDAGDILGGMLQDPNKEIRLRAMSVVAYVFEPAQAKLLLQPTTFEKIPGLLTFDTEQQETMPSPGETEPFLKVVSAREKAFDEFGHSSPS